MKKEKCWKSLHGCLCAAVLALFTFGFTSCKDDDLKGGIRPKQTDCGYRFYAEGSWLW